MKYGRENASIEGEYARAQLIWVHGWIGMIPRGFEKKINRDCARLIHVWCGDNVECRFFF